MNKITMNECSKRKLDELYVVVHAIKNELNIKKADYLYSKKSNLNDSKKI